MKKVFPLMELMVVAVLVGAIGLGIITLVVSTLKNNPDEVKPRAEAAALTWAKNMGYGVALVDCAGTDSDYNGYASCTLKTAGDLPQLISLECSSGVGQFTEGCRLR
jgi:hypothetical protein